MAITNNLYPPLVDTYMPAFIRTSPCYLYFSISDFNSLSDINRNCVQVIISYQNSSLSALDTTKYPTGIMLTDLMTDGDGKYYITISPSDLQGDEGFEAGVYYKVQLRFTSSSIKDPDDFSKIASWLSTNQQYFSEWSTVCLIRGISQPSIYLRGFDDAINVEEIVFYNNTLTLVGELYYEDSDAIEDEYMTQYRIYLSDANSGNLLYDTGSIYTNEYCPNEINYTLKYMLTEGTRYLIEVEYLTNNLYSNNVAWYFSVFPVLIDTLDATLTATADVKNGRFEVQVLGKETDVFYGNICIRRSSSETNFTIWEDVHIAMLSDGTMLDYTWYDYTVQGGVYYRYGVQKIDEEGRRGSLTLTRYPVMIYLEDMFLTRNDFQLKIRFDPQVTSFKHYFVESKTETLGSQYPYIRRNGNVDYRTFSIGGLITAFCDADNIFTSREDLYQDMEDYYNEFNSNEQVSEYNDFIYEKYFRDKVMDFLYSNDVKLFRSLTEGNILVKLMDITFTPNQTLGRMLYSFTATAYEIDECNIDNYNKYGVLTVGEYSDYVIGEYEKYGQVEGTISAKTEVLDLIQEQFTNDAFQDYTNTVEYLTWIRIDFQGDPYFIRCGKNKTLTPLTKSNFSMDEDVVYGYIVYINEEPVLVSPRGYYELHDEDIKVTSIYFPVDTYVIIDYSAIGIQHTNEDKVASTLYYSVKVGQLWGTFDVDDSIFNRIYLKHYEDYSSYYQRVIAIDKMTVESEPGTVVYVKDSFDDLYYRHVLGFTGVLDFYDDEATISAAYFCGVHLDEMKDASRLEPEDSEFRESGITVNTLDEIENPEKNTVYTASLETLSLVTNTQISEKIGDDTTIIGDIVQYQALIQELANNSDHRYIYYHNNWYVFTEDNDVLCPVQGLVDYIYESIKGVY